MLTKLKMECGAQLTQKMEGMMSNMELGRENRNECVRRHAGMYVYECGGSHG